MKTVLRIFILVGVVFTTVFLTSSCKDDDKDDQTSIIGTWSMVQTETSVERTATATLTQKELEAALANYLKVAVNSRIVFTATQVSFPLSVNGGTTQNVTDSYTLNDGTISIVLPFDDPKALLGNVDLKDNTLKITMTSTSYMKVLQYYAAQDATFKTVVDQIASATVYYRMDRVTK